MAAQAFGNPFLLAADGVGEFAALDTGAQIFLESLSGDQRIGMSGIELAVALIEEREPVVGVVEAETSGERLDRGQQPGVAEVLVRSRSAAGLLAACLSLPGHRTSPLFSRSSFGHSEQCGSEY